MVVSDFVSFAMSLDSQMQRRRHNCGSTARSSDPGAPRLSLRLTNAVLSDNTTAMLAETVLRLTQNVPISSALIRDVLTAKPAALGLHVATSRTWTQQFLRSHKQPALFVTDCKKSARRISQGKNPFPPSSTDKRLAIELANVKSRASGRRSGLEVERRTVSNRRLLHKACIEEVRRGTAAGGQSSATVNHRNQTMLDTRPAKRERPEGSRQTANEYAWAIVFEKDANPKVCKNIPLALSATHNSEADDAILRKLEPSCCAEGDTAKVVRATCMINNSTISPVGRAKQLTLFLLLSEDHECEFGVRDGEQTNRR